MATTTNVYYTIKVGEDLSEIAERYSAQYGTTVESLCQLNDDISDPSSIYEGQKILISGTKDTPAANAGSTVTVTKFGLQAETDRTIFVMWDWNQQETENYKLIWKYQTSDNEWFIGSYTTTQDGETQQATYNAPENAIAVRVVVMPVSKTKTYANSTTTTNWTGTWSPEQIYKFEENSAIPAYSPSVTIDKYKLTAEINGIAEEITEIEFQVVQDNTSILGWYSQKIPVSTNHVSYVCSVQAGSEYKVRSRSYKGTQISAWSEYSSNAKSLPSIPQIIDVSTESLTSIKLVWNKINTAASYTIEYVMKGEDQLYDGEECFEILGENPVQSINMTPTNAEIDGSEISRIIEGLTSGGKYYIRIKALNDQNVESGWSDIKYFIIGTKPTAPTTWSSSTTVIVGEPLTLYWIHNSEDGSSLTESNLYFTINGIDYNFMHLSNYGYVDEFGKISLPAYTGKDLKKARACSVLTDHSIFRDGSIIEWKVSTAGVAKNQYGNCLHSDRSILRTIKIFSPPTLSMNLTDSEDTVIEQDIESFPFNINLTSGLSASQSPNGYYVVIKSLEDYETIDNFGNTKHISAGDEIYSEYFDSANNSLEVEISANKLTLENNVEYQVIATVSMTSGLTAESTRNFRTAFNGNVAIPFAEIGIDKNTISAYIRPFLTNSYLSVYRREYDGSFTPIAEDLDDSNNSFITDPHPSLDYARYRVVAKNKTNGIVSYNDIPGYLVGEKAAIIQWDEAWNNFETTEESVSEKPAWSGSMLKLPYNIDISDNNKPDVSLIEYIGRKYPVSYYGTHLRGTSTWSMVIPKADKETLYAIRRLSIWTKDVYVREPSGSGYWANITVSYSQKHNELTIPISFNITRVEGGI